MQKEELYNEFTNYINPFIYYSQAHTVGVDIKQDKYPNLKGICLVDKHTTYKEVAQGIFRLRKLNLGHTVILYSKDDGITSEKILKDQEDDKNIKKYI